MKNLKLLLALVLCLALVFTCMFSLSSCKKDENPTPDDNGGNNSTDQPGADQPGADQPGADQPGADQPSGDNPPVHTHSYDITVITKYPSVGAPGEKKVSCSCGDSRTETIDAITVTLPSLANVVAGIIGEHTYGIEIADGSEIVLVKEADSSNDGYKEFIAFNIAEASVSGLGGVFKGMLSIELGYASVALDGSVPSNTVTRPASFDSVIVIDVYVNGDAVSIAYGEKGAAEEQEIENISRLVYDMIASNVGLTYDQVVELYYAASTLDQYLPLVDGVIEAVTSVKLPETGLDVAELVTLIAGTVFTTEQDGNNTVYALNIENFNELIAAIEDKTVSELIDAEFGEGTAKSIADFIKSVPMTTVKNIVDKAATFSEKSGVPIEQIYALINLTVGTVSGAEFDIAAQIEANANLTVAAIIGQYYGNEDIAEYEQVLTKNITELVDTVKDSTLNDLYAMFTGIDPEEMTLTALIANYVYAIDSAVGFEVCVDADGQLVWAHIDLVDGELSVNVDGSIITVSYQEDGEELLNANILLFDNGELRQASVVAKYVDIEYDYVLDSTGTEYVEVKNEVVKTLFTLNYNNMGADGGYQYITFVNEEFTFNATITDNSDENGTELYIEFNAVDNESVELFNGTLEYAVSVNGESLVLNAYVGGNYVNVMYTVDAESALVLVTKNDDIIYKVAYRTSVDENGVQVLEYFEYVIGEYVYDNDITYDAEGNYVDSTSVEEYYTPIAIQYVMNDDGSVDYGFVMKTAYHINHEATYPDGSVVDSYHAEVETTLTLIGDENGFTINADGEEIVVEFVENGLRAEFEMDGDNFVATLIFDENGVTFTIRDESNILLNASLNTAEGIFEFVVNAYVVDGYEDEETGEFVVTSKELFNVLTARIDNGTLSFNFNDIIANVKLNPTEGGFTLDAELTFDGMTLVDGAVGLELVSTENSDTLVIDVDVDQFMLDLLSGFMGATPLPEID